jgi:hypothetical protein
MIYRPRAYTDYLTPYFDLALRWYMSLLILVVHACSFSSILMNFSFPHT